MSDFVWSILGLVAFLVGIGATRGCLKGIVGPHNELVSELGANGACAARVAAWLFVLPALGLLGFGGYRLFQDGKDILKNDKAWAEEMIARRMYEKDGIRLDTVELRDVGDGRFEGTASGPGLRLKVEATVLSTLRVHRQITWSAKEDN
jgi:hypothetical protein